MNIQYVTIPEGQNCAALFDRMKIDPPLTTEHQKEVFRDKLFKAQGAIEEALKEIWEKENDFEVGWDFDNQYWLHGGIYSERIFCPLYAETVATALRSVEDSERWIFSTVCEIIVNPDGKTLGECVEDRGEFYISDGTVYIIEDEMKLEFRKILGAEV